MRVFVILAKKLFAFFFSVSLPRHWADFFLLVVGRRGDQVEKKLGKKIMCWVFFWDWIWDGRIFVNLRCQTSFVYFSLGEKNRKCNSNFINHRCIFFGRFLFPSVESRSQWPIVSCPVIENYFSAKARAREKNDNRKLMVKRKWCHCKWMEFFLFTPSNF